jgi:hypothetical protein
MQCQTTSTVYESSLIVRQSGHNIRDIRLSIPPDQSTQDTTTEPSLFPIPHMPRYSTPVSERLSSASGSHISGRSAASGRSIAARQATSGQSRRHPHPLVTPPSSSRRVDSRLSFAYSPLDGADNHFQAPSVDDELAMPQDRAMELLAIYEPDGLLLSEAMSLSPGTTIRTPERYASCVGLWPC